MSRWLSDKVDEWRFWRRLRRLEFAQELLMSRINALEEQVIRLREHPPIPTVHKTWVPSDREAAVIERRLLEQSGRRVAGMAAKPKRPVG